jgi:hypothetical protein
MVSHDPQVDPEIEAAIERALDAAQLRAGEATATVIHPDGGTAAVHDGPDGDGD